jgi:hypothetical protein
MVIWHSLSDQTSDDAERPIAARGCQQLCLPPYAPGLTPSEEPGSTRKTALRPARAKRWTW